MRILIKQVTARSRQPITVAPTSVVVRQRPMRVLDFDVEARPLHWIGGDYVSKEITAMAWAWVDNPAYVECYLLGEHTHKDMLEAFRRAFNRADLVTGHYIRGFDLPLINGMLMEQRLPVLEDKWTQDTKIDKVKSSGLSSSQENLGATWELAHPKVHMDQKLWRDANRLTPEGLVAVRTRVTGDVQQHIEFREFMLRRGYLGPHVMWRSGSTEKVPEYTP